MDTEYKQYLESRRKSLNAQLAQINSILNDEAQTSLGKWFTGC